MFEHRLCNIQTKSPCFGFVGTIDCVTSETLNTRASICVRIKPHDRSKLRFIKLSNKQKHFLSSFYFIRVLSANRVNYSQIGSFQCRVPAIASNAEHVCLKGCHVPWLTSHFVWTDLFWKLWIRKNAFASKEGRETARNESLPFLWVLLYKC